MSEKCFCHLNGYAVKDSTARGEIETLKTGKVNYEDLQNAINAVNEAIATVNEKYEQLNTIITYLDIPRTASSISFEAIEGVDADNVQGAIAKVKEIAEQEQSVSADKVTFIGNGFESNNVQDAIAEVKSIASSNSGGTAEGTTYDNSSSNLEATTVQSAIDEVNSNLETLESIMDIGNYWLAGQAAYGTFNLANNPVYPNAKISDYRFVCLLLTDVNTNNIVYASTMMPTWFFKRMTVAIYAKDGNVYAQCQYVDDTNVYIGTNTSASYSAVLIGIK